MDVQGRTVIITGSGSGIGRAIALEFGRHGAKVVCCGRREDRLAETVALIEAEGGTGLGVPTDICVPAQVERLVATTTERFGPIDILFNNAGSFASIAGVHELDMDVWWRDVTVNLYGATLVIRQVLPAMLERNEGIIINMDGGRPSGGSGYGCGKAGLMELNSILVKELTVLESDVIVLGAGPGLVRTEMTEVQANSAAGQRWIPSTRESFEAGNLRQPEDIARVTIEVVRLARPEHNGQSYNPGTDLSKFAPTDA